MENKELQGKNIDDLSKALKVKREKLRELRFKDSNKQLKNVRQIRSVRTDIARILTAINNKKNKN